MTKSQTVTKAIELPESLHERVGNVAWSHRKTKSDVLRDAVEDISRTGYVVAEPEAMRPIKVRKLELDTWERAKAAAKAGGKTIAQAIEGYIAEREAELDQAESLAKVTNPTE